MSNAAKVKDTKKKPVAKKATKPVAKKNEGKSTPEPENVPSEEKMSVIQDYQVKPGDTGSPEVQVALITSRIEKLVGHLKANPSDNHSRRGLLGLVSKRRRLLFYLEKKEKTRYKALTKKIGLS